MPGTVIAMFRKPSDAMHIDFVRPYVVGTPRGYSVGVVLQECRCNGGFCQHRVELVAFDRDNAGFNSAADTVASIFDGAFVSTTGVVSGKTLKMR